MVKPTVLQAMSSGFIGGFGTATYLVVSYLVDHKYGYDTANLIGLVASSVLDFYLQQLVFVGSISSKPQFIWKFILVRAFEIGLAQVLFAQYIKYINQKKPFFYRHNIKGRLLVVRYAIQIIIFAVVTFPMRKYVIYT